MKKTTLAPGDPSARPRGRLTLQVALVVGVAFAGCDAAESGSAEDASTGDDREAAPGDGGRDGATTDAGGERAVDAAPPPAVQGPPGSLDTSFGSGGISAFPTLGEGTLRLIRTDASGYVFAGTSRQPTIGDCLQLAAVDESGSLRTSFGAQGRTVITDGTGLRLDEVAQLGTLSGGHWLVTGTIRGSAAMARFTASGARVTSFGTAGVARPEYDEGVPNGAILGAVERPDGTLVAMVRTSLSLGTREYDLRIFASDGGARPDTLAKVTASEYVEARPAKDGGLWITATYPYKLTGGHRPFVTHLQASGAFATFSAAPNPDYPQEVPTRGIFAGSANVIASVTESWPSLYFQTGTSESLAPSIVRQFVRVDATTGAPDTTFGTGGRSEISWPRSGASEMSIVASDPKGGIIVALHDNQSYTDKLIRIDGTGGRDMAFGVNGIVSIPFLTFAGLVDAKGRLVVAGSQIVSSGNRDVSTVRIARLNL